MEGVWPDSEGEHGNAWVACENGVTSTTRGANNKLLVYTILGLLAQLPKVRQTGKDTRKERLSWGMQREAHRMQEEPSTTANA